MEYHRKYAPIRIAHIVPGASSDRARARRRFLEWASLLRAHPSAISDPSHFLASAWSDELRSVVGEPLGPCGEPGLRHLETFRMRMPERLAELLVAAKIELAGDRL